MIDKLKQYSEAWAGFVEWIIDKGYKTDKYFIYATVDGIDGLNYIISDYELYGLAIEWLESKKIKMSIRYYPLSDKYDFLVYEMLGISFEYYQSKEKFIRSSEATKAGIIKGFEILNNQKEK